MSKYFDLWRQENDRILGNVGLVVVKRHGAMSCVPGPGAALWTDTSSEAGRPSSRCTGWVGAPAGLWSGAFPTLCPLLWAEGLVGRHKANSQSRLLAREMALVMALW